MPCSPARFIRNQRLQRESCQSDEADDAQHSVQRESRGQPQQGVGDHGELKGGFQPALPHVIDEVQLQSHFVAGEPGGELWKGLGGADGRYRPWSPSHGGCASAPSAIRATSA